MEDKVRTITEAKVRYDAERNFLVFTFSGNGFLYKQIRNMVGTLLKIEMCIRDRNKRKVESGLKL